MALLAKPGEALQFTYRHLFAMAAFAGLAIVLRKLLTPISPTWAMIGFGALLFGGQQAVFAHARDAFKRNATGALRTLAAFIALGGVLGFIISLA